MMMCVCRTRSRQLRQFIHIHSLGGATNLMSTVARLFKLPSQRRLSSPSALCNGVIHPPCRSISIRGGSVRSPTRSLRHTPGSKRPRRPQVSVAVLRLKVTARLDTRTQNPLPDGRVHGTTSYIHVQQVPTRALSAPVTTASCLDRQVNIPLQVRERAKSPFHGYTVHASSLQRRAQCPCGNTRPVMLAIALQCVAPR